MEKKMSVPDISERPQTIAQALKQYGGDTYLYLPVLLKISGTFAVTSCECERSGSVLKLLSTYRRASTRQERLNVH